MTYTSWCMSQCHSCWNSSKPVKWEN